MKERSQDPEIKMVGWVWQAAPSGGAGAVWKLKVGGKSLQGRSWEACWRLAEQANCKLGGGSGQGSACRASAVAGGDSLDLGMTWATVGV